MNNCHKNNERTFLVAVAREKDPQVELESYPDKYQKRKIFNTCTFTLRIYKNCICFEIIN